MPTVYESARDFERFLSAGILAFFTKIYSILFSETHNLSFILCFGLYKTQNRDGNKVET